MNLERLEQLARTPRVLDERMEKIRARPMFFMRSAMKLWEQEMRNAPLVFAYVVQAEKPLFVPGDGGTGRAVFLHSTDPGYTRNARWLAELATRVASLRTERTSDRESLDLGMMLIDDQRDISLQVPLHLTLQIMAQLTSQALDVSLLPNRCIPESRVIPALALPKTLLPIPAELWL
jgi:hypothetical protein